MTALITRRVATLPLLVLLVTVLIFAATQTLQGNAASTLGAEGASQETIDDIEQQLGLDKNPVEQYGIWLGRAMRGDLGRSLISPVAVSTELVRRLPVTLELTAWAMVVSLVIGLPLGIAAARKPDGVVDAGSRAISIVSLGLPEFVIGLFLIYLFGWRLRLLPPVGYAPWEAGAVTHLKTECLPAVALGFSQVGFIVRQTRSALLTELSREYVIAARAKGLGNMRVLLRHALRNAWLPIVTIVGVRVGHWLGGSVIVEQLFGIPGVGRMAVDAINQQDIPSLQGAVLVLVVGVVIANLFVDLLYLVIDPRIRQG